MTAIEQAIELVGNQTKLAEVCKVTQQCISAWKKNGYVEQEYIVTVYEAARKKIPKSAFQSDLLKFKRPREDRLDPANRTIMRSVKRLKTLQRKGEDVINWLNHLSDYLPEQKHLYESLITQEQMASELRDTSIKLLTETVTNQIGRAHV